MNALDVSGLSLSPAVVRKLLFVDAQDWLTESSNYENVLNSWGERVPADIFEQLNNLRKRCLDAGALPVVKRVARR